MDDLPSCANHDGSLVVLLLCVDIIPYSYVLMCNTFMYERYTSIATLLEHTT